MRENRLMPFLDTRYKLDGTVEVPLERAMGQLERHTRYWPMIISQTTIFNMQAVSEGAVYRNRTAGGAGLIIGTQW